MVVRNYNQFDHFKAYIFDYLVIVYFPSYALCLNICQVVSQFCPLTEPMDKGKTNIINNINFILNETVNSHHQNSELQN